jgi:ATP-dependent RNA helicase HelY
MNDNGTKDFFSKYTFPLDPFQMEAINYLKEGKSVLVVAPTGSGKTLIAEYAISRAMEEGMKAFYTTPIKALSNQKFRDLSSYYGLGKTGLLTGDNSINPDAPIVVMTTEVLRNMLYERSDTLHGLRYVILDECHYLMDPFRGAVWEEIIIHLPVAVKIVALSATVSNYQDFGGWLNALRGDVGIVYAQDRPVPLRHYYFMGGNMLNLFSERASRAAAEYQKMLTSKEGREGKRIRPRSLIPRRSQVVSKLQKSSMLPAIYFIFSRAGCNAAVIHCLQEGLDLTTPREKEEIEEQAHASLQRLPEEDLRVFGYEQWFEALKRGVSSHHAGMLPLFKEIVEDLFARGLIKVVFATETLSLGINMPAKTVVIESLFKFNGESHELLTPTEYTQLTGRAGRRGIDKVGNGVVLYHPMVTLSQVQRLARRESLPLVSSFSLSYNMALNLLRSYSLEESIKIINESFAQYTADKDVVKLEKAMEKHRALMEKLKGEVTCNKGDAEYYLQKRGALSRMEKEMAQERRRNRIQLINHELSELAVGDVIVLQRKGTRLRALVLSMGEDDRGNPRLLLLDERGRRLHADYRFFNALPQVLGHFDGNLKEGVSKKRAREIRGWLSRFEVPAPEPWEDVERPHKLKEEIRSLKVELESHPCHRCQKKDTCIGVARKAIQIRQEIDNLSRQMEARSDVVSRKLANICNILQKLEYLEGDRLTYKGHMLSQIYNECDLLLSEVLWHNIISDLQPEELASFLSCFVYESRESPPGAERRHGRGRPQQPSSPRPPTHALERALDQTLKHQERTKRLEAEEALDLLRPIDAGFMHVAYDWADGCSLEYIIGQYPQLSAGDFVRSMKQVLDLLRQLSGVVDDPLLVEKFALTREKINRSIVAYTSTVDFLEEELMTMG